MTIVGRALPFSDLADPAGADIGLRRRTSSLDDPEVAADLAEARATGHLADDPAEAWGNAAIPGFGIGRPVDAPEHRPGREPAAARRRRRGGPVRRGRSRSRPRRWSWRPRPRSRC